MGRECVTENGQIVDVVWEPQPGPQSDFITCPIFEAFLGGARGGGKTDGVLGDWASHSDYYGTHATGLMVRRELTQLAETIQRSKEIFGPIGAIYHEQKKQWTMPNGSRLKFAYLDNDKDAEGYMGHSYSRVYVEEIGNFPNPEPINKLMGTLRSGHGIPCGFRATGNPGGPGHGWVRERYIDPAPLGYKIIEEKFKNPFDGTELTRERVFIPSKLTDNAYLGAEYVANLQLSGSPELVRAWLLGDWSIVAGAYFPEFSILKHVVPPHKIPAHCTRICSFDYGSAKPFCALWMAVLSDDTQLENGRILPKGAIVVYREWYGASKPNLGIELPNPEIGAGLRLRSGSEKIHLKRADPSIFKTEGGPSIAEQIKFPFSPADNTRKSGWGQVRSRLVGHDGRPMLYIMSTCPNLIRTLPSLQHDPHDMEDLDSDGEDHAADALRYGLMGRPYARPTIVKPPVRGLYQMSIDELWKWEKSRRRR